MTEVTPQRERIDVPLDRCDQDTIDRACHRFTDRYLVESERTDNHFQVHLTCRQPASRSNDLRAEFMSTLLDEVLRARIRGETRSIQEALVREAFAGAVRRR